MPYTRSRRAKWLKYYVEERLPLIVKHKPKVYAAFQKHSNLGDDARTYLRGHVGPEIRFVNMPGRYGYTPPGATHIELDKTFVSEMESALGHANLPQRNGRNVYHAPTYLETDLLLLLEATLLHEMVHFFRLLTSEQARANVSFANNTRAEEDIADQFETEAYGFMPDVSKFGLWKYLPKTAAYMKVKPGGP